MVTTVVSAYYKIQGSKHEPHEYEKWIRIFFKSVKCPILFFTDTFSYSFIQSCVVNKENTTILIVERSEWKANTFPTQFWEDQHHIDPQKNIQVPELYKVWYEKKEFIQRAIKQCQSTKFIWMDAGIIREELYAKMLKGFPDESKIPDDRLVILAITSRLTGAGILAGTVETWNKISRLYDETLEKCVQEGICVGQEQTVYTRLTVDYPRLFSVIHPNYKHNIWFYLLYYFSEKSS